MRVFELAKDLGVSVGEALAALMANGVFLRSAASTVTEAEAERARLRLAAAAASPAPERARSPFPAPRTAIEEASAIFGVRAKNLRPRREKTGRGVRPPVHGRQKPISPTEARWATAYMFDPAETRAWLAAGLGDRDEAIADQCRRFAIQPMDLAVRDAGLTLGARLRGGEGVGSIAARLQQIRQRGTA